MLPAYLSSLPAHSTLMATTLQRLFALFSYLFPIFFLCLSPCDVCREIMLRLSGSLHLSVFLAVCWFVLFCLSRLSFPANNYPVNAEPFSFASATFSLPYTLFTWSGHKNDLVTCVGWRACTTACRRVHACSPLHLLITPLPPCLYPSCSLCFGSSPTQPSD